MQLATEPTPDRSDAPRRFTRWEYQKMADAGVFGESERVELLDGEVVTMSPEGTRHAAFVRRLIRILAREVADRADVTAQSPYAAEAISLPEPDLAVVPRSDDESDYPAQAMLVVEVSLSSLRKDRTRKARIYCAAGVPEYWIVDLVHDRVEVHTEPLGDRWGHIAVVGPGARIDLIALPGVSVEVDEVFARKR